MSAFPKNLLEPTTVARPETAESHDVRIGNLLQSAPDDATRLMIIGFPSDSGVVRNGGRPGAREGPDAIRRHLYRFTPTSDLKQPAGLWETVCDAGNIRTTGDTEADQQILGEIVAWCLRKKCIPLVLGGGHETAFGHFSGYQAVGQAVHCVNLDAHLDVRSYENGAHSGSPYRQALELTGSVCDRYDVIGAQRHTVAAGHLKFAEQFGRVYFREDCREESVREVIAGSGAPVYLSVDLDVLDQSVAPGVSAPCVNGLSPDELYRIMKLLLGSGRVGSLDFVELNPVYDRDGATARLAAWLVWMSAGLLIS